MSNHSVSVYNTETSAKHDCLCTLTQNGHEFCKYELEESFKNISYIWKQCTRSLKIGIDVYANKDSSASVQTQIKHVFLLSFPHEFLMMLISH